MKVSRTLLTLCLGLGALALSGCNAGIVGIVVGLLVSDEDGGGAAPPSVFEFLEVQGARLRPSSARIRFALRNPKSAAASLFVEVSADGTTFVPATLGDPLPGKLEGAGRLARLKTSPSGRVHVVGWNAVADAGGPGLRTVSLRFSVAGSDPVVREVVVGNDPPALSGLEASQERTGEVRLAVTVSDSSSDPVDFFVEYGIPGPGGVDAFGACSLLDPVYRLESSPGGTVHQFRWASFADLGPADGRVVVRVTPLDWVEGSAGELGESVSAEICVDNNGAPSVRILEEELIADGDSRGGIPFLVSIRDPEGDPVDLVIQWAGEGEDFPSLSAELSDPEKRRLILASGEERASLRIATLRSEFLEGVVEERGSQVLSSSEIPATFLKSSLELRGLAREAILGRTIEVLGPSGEVSQRRIACRYRPEEGVLEADGAFDPPLAPGARIRLDLCGPEGALRLASSPSATVHRLIWDAPADAPGGGIFRLRATAYELGDSRPACFDLPEARDLPPCQDVELSSFETRGSKRISGPYLERVSATIPLQPIDRPSDIALGDIDRDGNLDIACTARLSDAVILFFQRIPGAYDSLRLLDQRLRGPSSIAVRDLDGDSRPDFAISASESSCVFLVFQRNSGDFFTDRVLLTARGVLRQPEALVVEDLDRDGDLDLATLDAANPEAPLVIFFRRGSGGISEGVEEGEYSSSSFSDPDGDRGLAGLVAADVFAGGLLELISVSAGGFFKIYAFENEAGRATISSRRIPVPGALLAGVAAVDADGDGLLDLVSCDARRASLVLVRQESAGSFGSPRMIPRTGVGWPAKIVSADVDGNSFPDLVVADPGESTSPFGGALHVFMGDAALRYTGSSLERETAEGQRRPQPISVAIGDLDGDGRLEIVSADDGTLDLAIFRLWTPGGLQSPPCELSSGQGVPPACGLLAADLDGDGGVDLITANGSSNDWTWYRQISTTQYAGLRMSLPEGASNCVAAVAGDVDGDGAPDIVTANLSSGDLAVVYQEPSGTWGSRSELLRSEGLLGIYSIGLGDLDGDGRLDLAAAGRFSNDVRWFPRLSDGGWGEARTLAAGADLRGPIRIATVDVDGDGRADIVTANQASRNVTVFFHSSTLGQFDPALALALPGGLAPTALALGDVDGDRRADIVVGGLGAPSAIAVLKQEAPRSFRLEEIAGESGANLVAIAVCDLDGDGRDEIVSCFSLWESSLLRIDRHDPAGALDEGRSHRLEVLELVGPAGLVAADLDRDGNADLAAVGSRSRNVLAWFGGR